MKLIKFMGLMIFFTIIALIYIQLQVQIFDLAYQGKNKENQIQDLMDVYSDVKYNIYRLKSANHLGDKMFTENSNLKFRDGTAIVMIPTSRQVASPEHIALSEHADARPNFFLSMFSLKAQAEAKTIK